MNSCTDPTFCPMSTEEIPLYLKWAEREHVKETWFFGGYEPVDAIYAKIAGNGYDFPFVILLNGEPIGYLQYCDLSAYRKMSKSLEGVFINEPEGSYCIDLFIAEESLLGQGIGTQVVRDFSDFILTKPGAKRVLADPSANNSRSIRCFEKAGFHQTRKDFDGTCEVVVMEKSN